MNEKHKTTNGINVYANQTLCWKCARACGGCSWSEYKRFEPVEGWVAEKVYINICHDMKHNTQTESYLVKECPQFLADYDESGNRVRIKGEYAQ